MTDKQTEALKLALEALEQIAAYRPLTFAECSDAEAVMGIAENAIPALREALAEQPAQQEPVAWVNQANLNSAAIQRNRGGQGDTHTWSETPTWDHSVPLYTSPPAQRTWVGLDWLPDHKCGLHLSHNEHRDVYETVEQFYEADDFISPDEWHKAVAEDSVWVLHWYPNTPIGFTRIAASTLEAIEAKLKEKNNG